MERTYLTREGLEKLRTDLESCNRRRMEVAGVIEHARELGDLRENAEYHAAKEEQAMLHARINDLESKLAQAVILEDQDIDATKVYVGATVRVLNKKTRRELVYTVVSPVEADTTSGKISVQSPVGKALLGKQVGDTTVAKVPAGDLELEILDVSR
jgi:transcription elongation factor GreA